MNPEPVTRQQVGHLADGQSYVSPLHMNIDLGTDQVEGRTIGVQSG